jgi:RNA-directed DNA polymerase
LDWHAVDWRAAEDRVRRLRQRIFAATQVGDLKRVRSLQKLMLRSLSNTLLSVRQVTERNAGRLTAGVDGQVVASAADKERLVIDIQSSPLRARPVRRVFIPKANGKLRPLGIPVISDRARQAQVRNALEPEWEARFEPKSYGFRPGRGCHHAIEAIYQVVKGKDLRRQWILDADLHGAFDHIDHDAVLDQLGSFPARGMIRAWLTAGVMDNGRFAPTEEGAPQGGVISPLILNIVLHGMETAAGVRYFKRSRGGIEAAPDAPVLVRYADDMLVFCHSREHAEQVKVQLTKWLRPRGLVFNPAKTQIVHVNQGCDFLGFNIRRYHGRLPLIKPSEDHGQSVHSGVSRTAMPVARSRRTRFPSARQRHRQRNATVRRTESPGNHRRAICRKPRRRSRQRECVRRPSRVCQGWPRSGPSRDRQHSPCP